MKILGHYWEGGCEMLLTKGAIDRLAPIHSTFAFEFRIQIQI